MSSIGNSGARSSGPTGCSVPGCSGGGGGAGRSGITLYHWRGISDSSRVILVRSLTTATLLAGGRPPKTPPILGGILPPRPPLGGRIPPRPSYPGGQATRVLTAAVSSAIAFFASAKYMLVLGSVYSSLSMPA